MAVQLSSSGFLKSCRVSALLRSDRRVAFSLVELLVVVAIIGLLLALLLPAVQSSREAARATACKSNLRQVAIALLNAHDVERRFPMGGWGRAWAPVVGRGTGKGQPGGWVYQTLPYFEEQAVFDGGGGSPEAAETIAATQPVFNCPSRRPAETWPAGERFPYQRSPRPSGRLAFVARGDFAINSGVCHAFRHTGPLTLAKGDRESYWEKVTANKLFTGISHMRRSASLRRVTDGASRTYLVGEKSLAAEHYGTGLSLGDDDHLYCGFDNDNHRFAASRPQGAIGDPVESILYYPPVSDTAPARGVDPHTGFGSAHPAGFHMTRCDGSLSVISFDVDPIVHYYAAHRFDGGSLDR